MMVKIFLSLLCLLFAVQAKLAQNREQVTSVLQLQLDISCSISDVNGNDFELVSFCLFSAFRFEEIFSELFPVCTSNLY